MYSNSPPPLTFTVIRRVNLCDPFFLLGFVLGEYSIFFKILFGLDRYDRECNNYEENFLVVLIRNSQSTSNCRPFRLPLGVLTSGSRAAYQKKALGEYNRNLKLIFGVVHFL